VRVKLADLNDWAYMEENEMKGGFTGQDSDETSPRTRIAELRFLIQIFCKHIANELDRKNFRLYPEGALRGKEMQPIHI